MLIKLIRILIFCVLLPLFYLNSCSGVPANSEFAPLVREFEKDMGIKVNRMSFKFSNLKRPSIGKCYPVFNIILIDKPYYDSISDIERKALVYHELAHCACHVGHVSGDFAHCPSSLMAPATTSKWCYDTKWKQYIVDLRSRCQ